jgi:hypothetical protein
MIGGGVAGRGRRRPAAAHGARLDRRRRLMARNVVRIDWDDPTEAFPAFLVMVGIPSPGRSPTASPSASSRVRS